MLFLVTDSILCFIVYVANDRTIISKYRHKYINNQINPWISSNLLPPNDRWFRQIQSDCVHLCKALKPTQNNSQFHQKTWENSYVAFFVSVLSYRCKAVFITGTDIVLLFFFCFWQMLVLQMLSSQNLWWNSKLKLII